MDQGIEHQQNFSGLQIGLVVLTAASNDIDDLRQLLSAASEVLGALLPGQVVRVRA